MRAGVSRAYIWTTDQVAAAAIETGDIADAAVTATKLAANAVETAKIADLAVTTGKIADLGVSAAKLAADAVETAKIKDLAVTTDKIADLAVTSGKIAGLAVTTDKIADLGVSAAKLAADAVETTKIKDLAVTTDKIADLAVTSGKIAAGAIYPSHFTDAIKSSRAKAYRSTTQSYNATTETKVQFDTEVFDLHNDYDNATNFRYTVATGFGGQYVVHAHVTLGNQASDTQPRLEIFLNGVKVQQSFIHQVGGLGDITCEIMGVLNLVAGDYVEIYVFSLSAGTILGDADRTYFEVYRLP